MNEHDCNYNKLKTDLIVLPTDNIKTVASNKCNEDNLPQNIKNFLIKVRKIYGASRFTYNNIENYTNSRTLISVNCVEHNKEFTIMPYNLLNVNNVSICSDCITYKKTMLFKMHAEKLHGLNTYNYDKVIYVNTRTQVKIYCIFHKKYFNQTPNEHLAKCGCPECGLIKRANSHTKTTDKFKKDAILVHGLLYDYTLSVCTGVKYKVIIGCNKIDRYGIKHGYFSQTVTAHIFSKSGCPKCAGNYKINTEECKERCKYTHGNTYGYNYAKYIDSKSKIAIECYKHGIFYQIPEEHYREGSGCPKCSVSNYSKPSIVYLEFMAGYHNIHIQHMLNGDEFRIPNTKYKADGYCKETNTIIEFYGTYWHADPRKFKFNDKNKTTGKLFGELFRDTIRREMLIKNLGYNLITIWEIDWKNALSRVVEIQRSFRKKHKYTNFVSVINDSFNLDILFGCSNIEN